MANRKDKSSTGFVSIILHIELKLIWLTLQYK